MRDKPPQELIIWRFLDAKPGHESQSLGLLRALERLYASRDKYGANSGVRCIDMPVGAQRFTPLSWLFKRFPPGFQQPRPDFIIGAGHRTHWPMLCARRAYGGHVVALMSPSLPKAWFNTVVAPEHDGLSGANVIRTRGVLNAMQPGEKKPDHTLVLVGGEGKHFAWDDDAVFAQIAMIMARFPAAQITDSRRTPTALRKLLASRYKEQYHPWDLCPAGWLAHELAQAETVWVSEDSVSMIYESLTAGCTVGLITVATCAGRPDRLAKGIVKLIKDGYVTRLTTELLSTPRDEARALLSEAERVATQLVLRMN